MEINGDYSNLDISAIDFIQRVESRKKITGSYIEAVCDCCNELNIDPEDVVEMQLIPMVLINKIKPEAINLHLIEKTEDEVNIFEFFS